MSIYDAWGEDGDFSYTGGTVGSNVAIGSRVRSGYARCSMEFANTAQGWRQWPSGPRSAGWSTHRLCAQPSGSYAAGTGFMWAMFDSSLVQRIGILATSGTGGLTLYKQDSSGTRTALATCSSSFANNPGTPDKMDVSFNYSTSGSVQVYFNTILVMQYFGDVTTESVTQLSGTTIGTVGNGNGSSYSDWSEHIFSSTDTRYFSLITTEANGAGTLDQWTGAYTNVNQQAVNDANFDTTTTSGNIQRYAMATTSVIGSNQVIAKVTNLRATQGSGLLTHITLAELIGGTAYQTGSVTMGSTFGPAQFIQATNPATSAAWLASDFSSSGRESGYKATT